MTDEMAPSPQEITGKVMIPADLALAQATEVHAGALKALEDAKDAVEVDLEGDGDPSIYALQMLISAKRTADSESIEITFSDKAKAVLEEIDLT